MSEAHKKIIRLLARQAVAEQLTRDKAQRQGSEAARTNPADYKRASGE